MNDAFYEALHEIKGQDLFLCCDPGIVDFRGKQALNLFIYSKDTRLKIPLGSDLKSIKELLGSLKFLDDDNLILIAWDLKSLLTFVRGKVGNDFLIGKKIFDLNMLESYCGEKNPCPTNFLEAKKRLVSLTKHINWEKAYQAYQSVYLPLILNIPKIETYGLAHKQKKIKVYPHYEIDGQINGRMKCSNISSNSYNPHTMAEIERNNLRCPGFDYNFLYFDFKHMEVNMLQWLSKDEEMKKILLSGKDFYESVWELLTAAPCNKERRGLCKLFFLPVFYGLGAESLSKKLNWPVESCRGLIKKIQIYFHTAWSWIKSYQLGKDGSVYDHFGRRRIFDNVYKVRNFVVQSPASLVCLHKLVLLISKLDIADVCMHIHDGYVISCKNEFIPKAYKTAKEILESENELYSGLKLNVDCRRGISLNELVSYNL
ncbi:MAG: hypothetical protein DWQ19_11185 [Crenarchaeota archaeon]|nr:MAG: hypothetical protein DWQ19_11185 [Thermoproteota archaeon]